MHIDIDFLGNVSPFAALLITWVIIMVALRAWNGNVRPRR